MKVYLQWTITLFHYSVSRISAELDCVMKERDSLAAQLKQDSETFNERLQSATANCKYTIFIYRISPVKGT